MKTSIKIQEERNPRRLPTFCGYTVDERLREFRRVDNVSLTIEFIPFDSAKGRKVLKEINYR
jgi:hypothetical protein